MPDSMWDMSKMHPEDLGGIEDSKTCFIGIVNNYPVRRRAVPYESIDLYANNSRTFRVYVKTANLDVVNVAGSVGVMTVKETKDSPIAFRKATNVVGQGQIGSPDQGELIFYINPSDTANLDIKQYVFDVRLTLSSGNTYTVLEGVINLQQTVG